MFQHTEDNVHYVMVLGIQNLQLASLNTRTVTHLDLHFNIINISEENHCFLWATNNKLNKCHAASEVLNKQVCR